MIVSPSLLSADFTDLRSEFLWLNQSRAQWIHFDVMDGVFVPNISFGFPILQAVHRITDRFLDVHLMIVEPWKYIDFTRRNGGNLMTIHAETCPGDRLPRTLDAIHAAGMQAGVAINPETAVDVLRPYLSQIDVALVMGVHPGFGGQGLIPGTPDKIRQLKQMIQEAGTQTQIEVDGGVNLQNASQLAQAGTDILVAGSAVFHSHDSLGVVATLAAM